MMFEKLELAPAYKVVCDTIEREILSGRLEVGQLLPTEGTLASQFGLTRHTVREGLRALEEGGLVRRGAGRRLSVSVPRHSELATRASRALVMQRVTFRELWEVSQDIETMSMRRAAPNFTADDLALMEQNIAETRSALDEGKSIVELDVQFHNLVALTAKNRVLMLAREPISLLFYPALNRLFENEKTKVIAPRRLLQAHENMFAALKEGAAERAVEWMRRHMTDFRRGFEFCNFDLDDEVDRSS